MEGLILIVYDQLIPNYLTYLVIVIALRAYAISLHPEIQVIVVNDITQIRSSYSVRLCASLIEKQFVPPMLIVYQQRHITIINHRSFFQTLQEHICRG